jgi:putative membrane protein
MNIQDFPTLNASLNLLSTFFLLLGYINIKQGKRETHKKFMVSALIFSALFLIFYSIYHYHAGSMPYPHHDWTRPVYFIFLIPHIILAAIMSPFILIAVWFAFREQFEKHRKIVRWLWPVWMYVSVSGVIIYLMLYAL